MSKYLNWLLVFLWMALIFGLSQVPGNANQSFNEGWFIGRKIGHVSEYFVLTVLLLRALSKQNLSRKKIICWAVLIAFLYAVSDECHQLFVFKREGRIMDVLIDSCGVLLATWLGARKVIR